MPLNRSGLASFETPCKPQSMRLLVCSTDMINKFSTIDTSPCPPGQTTDDRSSGTPNLSI